MTNNLNYCEDLLYNLPDYAAGKLKDKKLILKIESELISNPEFKSEYELILETISTVKDFRFSEPPEHYFTNLIPQINARLEKQNNSSAFMHFFRFANLLKYVLPALSVVFIIVIINYSNKDNKDKNMFIQSDNTINNIMNNKSESAADSNNSAKIQIEKETTNEYIEKKSSTENSELINIDKTKKSKKQNNTTEEINVNLLELFTENEENSDEYFYENDFNKLNQNEQNEILNKLSNTNF